jgi:hypothetical protein
VKIYEIILKNEPPIFQPQVAIPLDDYNLVKPILQRQQQARLPKPQPLTRDQLDQRLAAAHQEKLRKLAIILQNRKIWAQSELVTRQDKADAARIGEPEIPEISMEDWLMPSGDINWKAFNEKPKPKT